MRLLENHLRKSRNTGIRQQFDSISCFETRSLPTLTRSSHPRHSTCISKIPFLDSCVPKRFSVIKSSVNRRPNAATPGADGDGNLGREVYNVFSIAPRGAGRRANGQSVANHLRYGGRNNIGNTKTTLRKHHNTFVFQHLRTLANTLRFMPNCYAYLTPMWARVPFVG